MHGILLLPITKTCATAVNWGKWST